MSTSSSPKIQNKDRYHFTYQLRKSEDVVASVYGDIECDLGAGLELTDAIKKCASDPKHWPKKAEMSTPRFQQVQSTIKLSSLKHKTGKTRNLSKVSLDAIKLNLFGQIVIYARDRTYTISGPNYDMLAFAKQLVNTLEQENE